MKAKSNLNLNQQVVTRSFINEVLLSSDDGAWDTKKGTRKQLLIALYDMLGYQVLPNGKRILLGEEVKTAYGAGFSNEDPHKDVVDLYISDGVELNDLIEAEDTAETDTSEPTEGN